MSLGESFGSADDALTLLALIPVLLMTLAFTSNINNPNFEPIEAVNVLLTEFAYAMVPNISGIIVLGLMIWGFGVLWTWTDQGGR